MLPRVFELRDEVRLLLIAKQKNDLLSAFGGNKFFMYLAYLADMFEALKILNKKMQGSWSNILVPFCSTYLCECGFSALLAIKSKARSRLDVESNIRCALSATSPDIGMLVAKKQGHPSH